MATVTREKSGYYRAEWRQLSGVRRSEMTQHRDIERAIAEANQIEAISQFWDQADLGVFDFLAQNALSPDACHRAFTHRAHIPIRKFRELLREAKVEFLPANKQRGRPSAKGKRITRHRWKGKLLPLQDIMDMEGCTLGSEIVLQRLSRGWSVRRAIDPRASETQDG